MSEKQPYDNVEFDWIKLVADLEKNQESFLDKCKRKFNENPFVPIGKCSLRRSNEIFANKILPISIYVSIVAQ